MGFNCGAAGVGLAWLVSFLLRPSIAPPTVITAPKFFPSHNIRPYGCAGLFSSSLRFLWWERSSLIRGHTIWHPLYLTRSPPETAIAKNLALDTNLGGSFQSCPDLSSLQISQPSVSDGLDQDFNTEPSRSPSPDLLGPRGTKKLSNRHVVSRKARNVIGKVRAFPRIAAAKMAHPSIKIDTTVQGAKRGLPPDDTGPDGLGDQGNPRLEDGNTEDVPPFLCQSVTGE